MIMSLDTAGGERPGRRRLLAALAGVMSLGALAACGGGTEAPAPPENVIVEGQAPDYYPAEYSQIIEGSKAEPGSPARSR